MAAGAPRAEVLHESLHLRFDLKAREVQGKARLWVVLPAIGSEEGESTEYRLHARQMIVNEVAVNSKAVAFTYPHPLDLLKNVSPPPSEAQERLDGEALDLHYRCQLVASHEGELSLFLPRDDAWQADSQKPQGEELREGEKEGVPQVVLNAKDMRIYKVDIQYTLKHPIAGLRFEANPPHAYSVRCPGVLHDVDGPRCWFPCADRTTDVFTLDLSITVPQKEVTVLVGGGQLLETMTVLKEASQEEEFVWRYVIETPITASAVSLVVGQFKRLIDPAAPQIKHFYLVNAPPPPPAPLANAANGTAYPKSHLHGNKSLPPRSWVANAVSGMSPVVSFLADFFNLASLPSPQGKASTIEHVSIFVQGLPEESVAFHGLTLHRTEDLYPPNHFDPSMALHIALTEGLFAAWLMPRLRPRFPRDLWIFHGVLGYLVLLYVRRRYGENEYRYRLLRLMDAVIALERSGHSMPLQPPADSMLFSSESYNPRSLALIRLKPPIIIHMIEQRTGRKPLRDVFRAIVCPTFEAGVTKAEGHGDGGEEGGDAMDVVVATEGIEATENGRPSASASIGPVRPQALRTLSFLRLCLKTSTRGEFLSSLRESWLEGRGTAFFQISYAFDRRSPKPQVTLTLRQVVPPWGRRFTGMLRIRIVEDAGPYDYDKEVSQLEHVWTFKLHSKVRKTGGGRRSKMMFAETVAHEPKAKKRKKAASLAASSDNDGGGSGAEAPAASSSYDHQDEDIDEYTAARREHYSSVVWVRIDPEMQWICEVEWDITEYLLIEQLHKDPDAAAQCLALRSLVYYPRPTDTATTTAAGGVIKQSLASLALSDCVRGRVRSGWVEPSLNVRMEAARALSTWQNHHAPVSMMTEESGLRGLSMLFRSYKERFFDISQKVPSPADFRNEAEYQLQKSLIWAISTVRARDGCTPPVVWDFLGTILEGHDNSSNPFNDSAFLSVILLSLCNLRIGVAQAHAAPALVDGLITQVKRCLIWYQGVGSYDDAVVAATIRALCNLEMIRGDKPTIDYLRYARPGGSLRLRLSAIEAIVQLRLRESSGGREGMLVGLEWLLNVIEREKAEGSMLLKFKSLQALLETLRHPQDYRPLDLSPLALSEYRLLDHLHHEGRAYDIIDPARNNHPFTTISSTINPALVNFRSASESFQGPALPLRRRLWQFINEKTWYNQPLRLVAFWVYQYIWGYTGPVARASEAEMVVEEGAMTGVEGLEDVYMEVLSLRRKGVISLRSTFLDEKDWRTWHPPMAPLTLGGSKKQKKGGDGGAAGAAGGGDDSDDGGGGGGEEEMEGSDEEMRERMWCRQKRSEARRSNTKLRLKLGGGGS